MKVPWGFWVRLAKRGYWDGKERGRRLARSCLLIPTGSSCSCISAGAVSRQSDGRTGQGTEGTLDWWSPVAEQVKLVSGAPEAFLLVRSSGPALHPVHRSFGEPDAQGSHSTTREEQGEKKERKPFSARLLTARLRDVVSLYAAGDRAACALPSASAHSAVLHHMVAPFPGDITDNACLS